MLDAGSRKVCRNRLVRIIKSEETDLLMLKMGMVPEERKRKHSEGPVGGKHI